MTAGSDGIKILRHGCKPRDFSPNTAGIKTGEGGIEISIAHKNKTLFPESVYYLDLWESKVAVLMGSRKLLSPGLWVGVTVVTDGKCDQCHTT